ncbi:hypothetical protein J6590_052503 [Homalodisca vitripennis]|nr:hypothetical protein J6590_052503 [Homalodisca vitripennis]
MSCGQTDRDEIFQPLECQAFLKLSQFSQSERILPQHLRNDQYSREEKKTAFEVRGGRDIYCVQLSQSPAPTKILPPPPPPPTASTRVSGWKLATHLSSRQTARTLVRSRPSVIVSIMGCKSPWKFWLEDKTSSTSGSVDVYIGSAVAFPQGGRLIFSPRYLLRAICSCLQYTERQHREKRAPGSGKSHAQPVCRHIDLLLLK